MCGGGGGTIRILGGDWSFLEINIFVGKMGEINKWPQDIMVEINILFIGWEGGGNVLGLYAKGGVQLWAQC